MKLIGTGISSHIRFDPLVDLFFWYFIVSIGCGGLGITMPLISADQWLKALMLCPYSSLSNHWGNPEHENSHPLRRMEAGHRPENIGRARGLANQPCASRIYVDVIP